MVYIKRGEHTLKVTQGAFLSLYKSMGYTIVGSEAGHMAPSGPHNGITLGRCSLPDEEAVDDYEDTLDEKPISEMNFKELKEYANRLGINTNGMSNKKELRTAIYEAEND